MPFRRVRQKVRDVGVLELLKRGIETGAAPRLFAGKLALDTRISYLRRAELARTPGADVFAFGSEESITLDAPSSAPSELERMAGSFSLEQPFVCRLPRARLIGRDALSVRPDGSLLLETSLGRRDTLEQSLLANPSLLRRALWDQSSLGTPSEGERRLQTVCSLVDGCLGGYSHWVLTALPRLEGLRRWEEQTGERATILVPDNASSWVLESLAFFGYGPERVETWTGEPTTVEGLLVPSVRSLEQPRSIYAHRFTYDLSYKLTSPAACRWLRSVARETTSSQRSDTGSEIEPRPAGRGRRVYISRSDADRRRVRNRDELLDSLADRGFERYTLSSLSFAEQVRLFLEADIVVAPHGAGLANSVFANDCAVVELFGSKIKPTYWMLAAALGLEYEYYLCESVGDDLRVDVAAVTDSAEPLL
ncbi:glycosyltransferase family 61 protein [Halostagnicola bangensis]